MSNSWWGKITEYQKLSKILNLVNFSPISIIIIDIISYTLSKHISLRAEEGTPSSSSSVDIYI